MANDRHVDILKQGSLVWNDWRILNREARIDLSGVDLTGLVLSGADLRDAMLMRSDLKEVDLTNAKLNSANFRGARLERANLSNTEAGWTIFCGANLSSATLDNADLTCSDFYGANLKDASLRGADLSYARFIETNLEGADLEGASIYGISAWRLKLEGANQSRLVIRCHDEPVITVDDLEIAQWVYVLINNERIRNVIDGITSKAVLILGRFTPERKLVLNMLREELRQRHYVPILFDFEKPSSRDLTETVTLLARMARFIIADITDPSSVPHELYALVPDLRSVPVQIVLQKPAKPYAMLADLYDYSWVLPPYYYNNVGELIESLSEKIIDPAVKKAEEIRERRRLRAMDDAT
jgi:hypothetical protein